MVMPKKAVEVRNLSLEKNGKKILKKVNFQMDRDERVVICGPSGSGKTSLIRCLNGLDRMTTGSVKVFGAKLTDDIKSVQAVRSKTGMLFQSFNLFPHLTILENCRLPLLKVRSMSQEKALEMAEYYLDKVKILDQANKYPIALSGGQQQRAAIARALCMEPELLLFDEPTSALDPEMVGEVLDVLNDLSKAGMTMIVVTHEMRFAKKFADRVVFIDEGEIVVDTDVKSFFAKKNNVRVKSFLSMVSR